MRRPGKRWSILLQDGSCTLVHLWTFRSARSSPTFPQFRIARASETFFGRAKQWFPISDTDLPACKAFPWSSLFVTGTLDKIQAIHLQRHYACDFSCRFPRIQLFDESYWTSRHMELFAKLYEPSILESTWSTLVQMPTYFFLPRVMCWLPFSCSEFDFVLRTSVHVQWLHIWCSQKGMEAERQTSLSDG